MDNIDKAAWTGAELTCAQSCYTSSRVYVGATDGSVRAIAANVSCASSDTELPLTQADWESRLCAHAVTSVCGIEANKKEKSTLLVVGSAGGELVLLHEDLEIRRFQLESAVQKICYDPIGEFIVGDVLGNLYGVTQYEIRWKRRLPAFALRDDIDSEFFYPAVAQPTVQAITYARLLDVEKTLSNYILVATGQKYLVLTHCGKSFGTIPTRTPIVALVSIPVGDEDIVLASGEEGIIYRLESYREIGPKNMPSFRFAMNMWAQLEFAWICLGVNGEVTLFRGRGRVKEWTIASYPSTRDVELDFPVDLTLLNSGDVDKQPSGAIVFPGRICTFSIQQSLSIACNRTTYSPT
ncbi:unnamed protein product [Peronospora belbahrii]|uniref:CNH domain-containing protein n=1 Tax=Peronospora belbahrii TaxID=622444 RepID=A0ABN8CS34_9STRA|nr:unnamed protein product [Peronospora belbahrii]